MKRVVAVLAVLLLGAAFAQPVSLGVNLELSGRFATIGTSTLQGIETARQQMSEVLGREVQLSICDNATTVEGSVACANRFVDEGVSAVLGPIASSMAIPAAEVLQDAGITMISTSSTNPATTQIGDYIFRMAYNDQFQGRVAAEYMVNELGASRVAIFRQQDDDYSFGLSGYVQDALSELGADAIVVDYVANTVDFSAQISDIQGYNPDVIYFAGFCAEGASLVPQLRQQGFAQQIMGADAADDSQCPSGGGTAFDGFRFTAFAGPELLTGDTAERASEFASFFRGANPTAADFNGFTLAGADSYNVIVEAIRVAGTDEAAAVRDALANIEGYPGVSGDITYVGTDGTPADRVIGLFEYNVESSDNWESVPLSGISLGE
jgi:branched-chain amino acid transport system substrate-binding protein